MAVVKTFISDWIYHNQHSKCSECVLLKHCLKLSITLCITQSKTLSKIVVLKCLFFLSEQQQGILGLIEKIDIIMWSKGWY